MSTLKQLINKFCPHGVERKKLWELTSWNKKFNGVEKAKQKKIVPIKCILASEFEKIKQNSGNVKYIATGISGKEQYTTEELAGNYLSEGEVVCIPGGGTPNVKYHNGKFITSGNYISTSLDKSILNNKFLYYYLDSKIKNLAKFYRGSGIKHPDMSKVLELTIPLPPVRVQEEIVKILDKFTDLENELENELRMRKMQFNAYRDKLLTFDNGVKFEKLGTIAYVSKGKQLNKDNLFPNGRYAVINGGVKPTGYWNKYNFHQDLITISQGGASCGFVDFQNKPFWAGAHCYVITDESSDVNYKFLYYVLKNKEHKLMKLKHGAGIPSLTKSSVETLKIPVPPLEKQKEIVEKLDKFNEMCNEISEGLPLEIELRKKQKKYILNKLLNI